MQKKNIEVKKNTITKGLEENENLEKDIIVRCSSPKVKKTSRRKVR